MYIRCRNRYLTRKLTINCVNLLFIFLLFLLVILSTTIQLVKPVNAIDYISDRLCQNVSSNIKKSLVQASGSTNESFVATILEKDGAKYAFWVQCYPKLSDNLAPSSSSQSSKHSLNPKSINDNFMLSWIEADEPTEANDLMLVKDKRYTYLVSVSRKCEPVIQRHCQTFRVGLHSQESDKRCPSCGLNDINCEMVNLCKSSCGQIKSTNYPQNYGNNHRCRWKIIAPNSYYVNLSIVDFDIPSSNNASKLGTCIFDYLTLIDGYSGKRIGCYCNDNLPPPYIVSPWNELIIQFDTNSETAGRGFYFTYELMKLELNERIKNQLSPIAHNSISPGGNASTPAGTSNVSGPCPNNWQYFRGSCYKAYNEIEPLQWYDAESKCNTFGAASDGHLVSILDKNEMIVILYWLTNVWNSARYKEYYIGLIDASREGLYRWSDNNPMSYTDWELKPMLLEDETPAQPDGGAYEDCTVIRYNSFSRTSNWHDVPCSLGKHYHSHLEKGTQIGFKWDYVSSYICKSDSTMAISKVRRPLFSEEFEPSQYSEHMLSHLAGVNGNATRLQNILGLSSERQVIANLSLSLLSIATNLTTNSGPIRTDQLSLHLQQHQQPSHRYFVCNNLEVISAVLRCDGVAHCRDSSDESNGCEKNCLDWQYKCANGNCIPIGYYCDFKDDCGDGSDESHCERHRCKLNEFRCQSGQCISAQQRCDLLPDCHDSSDEGRKCTSGSNCNSASTFQCYNGNCIPQYAVCDFQIDCPGKFHEDEDVTTCDLLQKSHAINMNQLSYNKSVDSYGGASYQQQSVMLAQSSQVVFYSANQVTKMDDWMNKFKCTSGNMIESNLRCLYEFDKYGYQIGCRDVSHLSDCADFECPDRDYVKCPNSYCIPWRYVCNGRWDCRMGEDEAHCARYVCPGQYKCANQTSCILLHQLCDGQRQCSMGDDEWFCDLQCPLGCECIGQSVNCRYANMTQLPNNYISRSVRKLDLSYNRLGPNLNQSNFDSYYDLGELILQRNRIEVLPPRKFLQLRNLYKLDLSYNRIHSVKRGAFAGLRRVTQLLLESNQQLCQLEPEAFLGLNSLQVLNLSSSSIYHLKKNTFDGLSSLRILLLRSNNISIVDEGALKSLVSLVSLDMRNNSLDTFAKSNFGELKSLRNLSTDSFRFCCMVNHQIPADKCLPLPDEISDCEDLLGSVPQRTCIWVAGAVACVGNLVVIIWRYRDRLGPKEREPEQVNSTLLLSLAFSDLLMGIYLIIIALVDSWHRGRYIEKADNWRMSPLCNLCAFLSTVSSTVSVWTLVTIAYNRYLEICRPLNDPKKFTPGHSHRVIWTTWCSALALAFVLLVAWPRFEGGFKARSGVCLAFHITDQKAAGWLYSILVSPCINLIAFIYIFLCYRRIYLKISEAARRNQFIEQTNHQVKIILIVFTHSVAFSPPIILGFMQIAGYRPPPVLYSWIAVLVLPVNSAINPMIYTIPNIKSTIRLLIKNYKARKFGTNLQSGASISSTTQRATGSTNQITSINRLLNGQAKELMPMLTADALVQRLAQRNVPPGYMPVKQYFSQKPHIDPGQLVQIALGIARDIEEKHRQAKVYASLTLDDIFVSDCVANADGDCNEADQHLVVFIADHDGYRSKRSQQCSHVTDNMLEILNDQKQNDGRAKKFSSSSGSNSAAPDQLVRHQHQHHHHHHHRHHKTNSNCECADLTRFGDILFKLIQLYNKRKMDRANEESGCPSGGGGQQQQQQHQHATQ